MKTANAPEFTPMTFYGLHFAPGVAEWIHPETKKRMMIYISPEVAQEMDKSFAAKPVYVKHVEQPDYENFRGSSAGSTFRSFLNEADGMHWVEFTAETDEALKAIRDGWLLSNAFVFLKTGTSGKWHGVDYDMEILSGEYEHLAIVPVPRYKESVILTPDEFRAYNEEKLAKLKAQNSSDENPGGFEMFKFFSRENVDSKTAELLSKTEVELTKTKKMVPLAQLITNADEAAEKEAKGEKPEANPEHMVKMHNGKTCNVGELVKLHETACNALDTLKEKHPDSFNEDGTVKTEEKNAATDEEAEKKAKELEEHEKSEIKEKAANAAADQVKKDALKAKNEAILKAANAAAAHEPEAVLKTESDMLALGKKKYGSATKK